MIIGDASNSGDEEFQSFDVGDASLWLDEVYEFVSGLLDWRSDPEAEHQDRRVIVAVADDRVVGVTAHERLAGSAGRVWNDHRYLMVTAVRPECQRTGLAWLIVESVLADLRSTGCETVEWLVHPSNRPSIDFSRKLFPEADETQPPDDHPYVSSTKAL